MRSFSYSLEHMGVAFQALKNIANRANLLQPAIVGSLDHVLNGLVEAQGIMLQEQLQPRALNERRANGYQRFSQVLNLFVRGVVELATALSVGAAVADLLESLKRDFQMAFAL